MSENAGQGDWCAYLAALQGDTSDQSQFPRSLPAPGEQLVAALGALVHPAGEVVLVLLPLPEGGEHCPAAVLLRC